MRRKFELLIANFDKTKINQDAFKIFKFLKSKGVKIALVSNARSQYIRFIIDLLGIKGLLDLFVSNDQHLKPKPSPEMYIDRFGCASMYNFIPNFDAYDDPEVKRLHANTIKTMSMRQRVHDTFQNLLMLQGILDLHSIPLFVSTWDSSTFVS